MDGTSGAVSSTYVRAEVLETALQGASHLGETVPDELSLREEGLLPQGRASHFPGGGVCWADDKGCSSKLGSG